MTTQLALILAVTTLSCLAAPKPAGLPENYRLLYEQTFDQAAALEEFVMTDPAVWKISKVDQGGALSLTAQSKYSPPVRSPVNIALLANKVFGDFVIEVDLVQTGREYGHRDMCFFFGVQNPTNFYYVHLATAADQNAHNVFLVKNKPRTNIAKTTTKGVNWGLEVWHHVKIERRTRPGTIKVYFDDMTQPIMTAEDQSFDHGWIGFGSFDDTGKVDNIRVWGTSVETQRAPFFRPAKP